jgi:hypothetical protein
MGAGVAQSLSRLATHWTTGPSSFDPLQSRKDFSSSLCVQTGSGAHPASCTMDVGGPILGGKARSRRDVDHLPPSSAEVVNERELYLLSPLRLHRCVVGLLNLL